MKTAICLLHKDENRFLSEWVFHHLACGFDHVFIYDNNSVIVPYFFSGKVTVINWNDNKPGKQVRAYNHFVEKKSTDYDWVCFADTDEFLTLVKHKNVKDLLKDYDRDEIKILSLLRLNYSCENLYTIKSVRELKKHSRIDHQLNRHTKSFLKLPEKNKIKCVHKLLGTECGKRVSTEFNLLTSPFLKPKKELFEVAYFKHFGIRGIYEIYSKCHRGPGQNSYEQKYGSKEKLTCFKYWADLNRQFNRHNEGEILPKIEILNY